METEKLREALQSAGVTQYEAEAYIAVLERGSAAATEVADASGVPQARVYDVLRNLADKGYIETYQEGTLQARANDPAVVTEDLGSYAQTITNAADEIEQRYTKPDVEDSKISVVTQPQTVYDRARSWIADADREIEVAATPSQFRQLEDALADAEERGVVVKLTLSPEWSDDSENSDGIDDAIETIAGTVTEARHRDMHTPFLVIIDRNYACFAPESSLPTTSQYGVFVSDYSLSRVFYWFFQTALWDTWDIVYSSRADSVPAVYSNIRECLRHIKPEYEDGKRVVLTVVGHDVDSGDPIELTGEVTNLVYADYDIGEETPPLESMVEEARIDLAVDGEDYEIGGWGAYLEDIEGERFVVELIE